MTDVWSYLFENYLVNVFGDPYLLGLVVLAFIAMLMFFTNASKVLILPLLTMFSYGLLQAGLIPGALFAGLLIVVAVIFAIIILNLIFNR